VYFQIKNPAFYERKPNGFSGLNGLDLAAGKIIPVTGDCHACAVGVVLERLKELY
jgi:hypothetical protein